MNTEIPKSYLTEVFSSLQGEGGCIEGSCFGKRQIFIRFSGCNLSKDLDRTSSCFWCDSLEAQSFKNPIAKIEEKPGLRRFINVKNPLTPPELADIINNLITKDLHSISFTGGEPLYQIDFIVFFLGLLEEYQIRYPLYLETNGTIIPTQEQFYLIAKYFKFCCCDIKDRSSNVAKKDNWNEIVNLELEFIEKCTKHYINTFAKIIVTSETKIDDIVWISKKLAEIKGINRKGVGLAIQPVYLYNESLKNKYAISADHLNQIFYTVADYLSPTNISLSIQAHKYLDLL
ncbi:MAG: 7-carboxy-7-deazaguanine synthase QueE [Candidatus Lokiarchaeota archaeon]|nr:7-carboxy-7-deazaguanine synthase QueE [Candidatus Lokiarchaeota archaeon]